MTRSVFVVLMLFYSLVLAGQNTMPQPFSADMTLTSSKGKLIAFGKYIVAPPKVRIDISRDPQQGTIVAFVFDQTEKSMMALDPRNKVYTKAIVEGAPNVEIFPDFGHNFNPDDPCAGTPTKCKHVKSDVIDGRPCEMWDATTERGTTRRCIDQKLHYPIWLRQPNGNIMKFSNIVEKQPDPSLFEPPSDYKNSLDEDKEKSKKSKDSKEKK
jgi:hypothetical protein